jgi:hypothetical protein
MLNRIKTKYEKFKDKVDNNPKFALLAVSTVLGTLTLTLFSIAYPVLQKDQEKRDAARTQFTQKMDTIKQNMTITSTEKQH